MSWKEGRKKWTPTEDHSAPPPLPGAAQRVLDICHSLSLCPSSPATFPIPRAPSLSFFDHSTGGPRASPSFPHHLTWPAPPICTPVPTSLICCLFSLISPVVHIGSCTLRLFICCACFVRKPLLPRIPAYPSPLGISAGAEEINWTWIWFLPVSLNSQFLFFLVLYTCMLWGDIHYRTKWK